MVSVPRPEKDPNRPPLSHAKPDIPLSQGAPVPCNDTRICPPGGSGGGCVQDGPFKDYVVHMGPWNDTGVNRNDQCLKRNFNPSFAKEFLGSSVVQNTLVQTTFDDFILLFGGIKFSFTQLGQHGAGHVAVGGVV